VTAGRPVGTALFPLFVGALLMSAPETPLDAADQQAGTGVLLTDFTANSPDLGWYVQNDNVMGGRSEGGFSVSSGELLFSGSTNTNGGGFSSIRTAPFAARDLSACEGIRLRLKGDGRTYIWQLQTGALRRGGEVGYWTTFDTRAGEWMTVDIPFARFYPQFRGFKLDGPELDTRRITELGLYIYDNKDGPFELRLDSVQAYGKCA